MDQADTGDSEIVTHRLGRGNQVKILQLGTEMHVDAVVVDREGLDKLILVLSKYIEILELAADIVKPPAPRPDDRTNAGTTTPVA